MTHMRYWAATFATALAGGFIALTKFAFTPEHAIWVSFGVAIAAGVFALAATVFALVRENHRFSGLSAISVLLSAFTIIAVRDFTGQTALWLAFSGGLALLLVSLRALALHESTVERVVHSLRLGGNGNGSGNSSGKAITVEQKQTAPLTPFEQLRQELEISGQMRSWMHWLTHTALGIAGGFVALTSFAWRHPVPGVQPRWVWFGVGVTAVVMTITALAEHGLAAYNKGINMARAAAIAVTAAGALVAAALVTTMRINHGITYHWVALGLGAAMVGVSIVASTIHELTTERVRAELEVAQATSATREVAQTR